MRKSPKQSSPRQDLSRKRLGDYGEALVARWYEAGGGHVVERQWHGPEGEIDLIVRDAKVLIFCEVKTRSSAAFGSPLESITWKKQQRIRKTAMAFLQAHESFEPNIRFDVACVMKSQVTVIENAF